MSTSLQFLKGVGPQRAASLAQAGLSTVGDLLERLPVRYEDRGRFRSVGTLKAGESATVSGEVIGCGVRPTRRRGFTIFEAVVKDDTGAVRAVWMNQGYLRDVIRSGQRLVLFGPVEHRTGLQLLNPQFEVVGPDGAPPSVHTGRIVPVYERIGSLTSNMRRRLVHDALSRLGEDVEDPLPDAVRHRLSLPSKHEALRLAHFPDPETSLELLNAFRSPAQVRLIVEELFLFQLGLLRRRQLSDRVTKPVAIVVDERIREAARRVLPFRLTPGQRRALQELVADLRRPHPMNRLLQGDVGAGKTIVALLTALVTMENGLQVAFMAPTEILAEQHYATLRGLLEPSRFEVGLLTGSQSSLERRDVTARLADGRVHLVVGTHALLQGDVAFHALGLVVIDEQHRFGVMQRAALREKGTLPDVLVMTATPIPRTLALTAYGDLDVSSIRDRPAGRPPVETEVRPEHDRAAVYARVGEQLEAGRQAYVIYPLVAESEALGIRGATEMAAELAESVFPGFRVALLHGRLKADEKEAVMRGFSRGAVQLLVSTTVVEVGVDVPNATVIVVEHADRFGLAQLHQLRGRVGRGRHRSRCVLLYREPLSAVARDRLAAMVETTDGFVLADRDLALRGPGDFVGTRQSGVPALRVGDLLRDHRLMEEARREAQAWLDTAAGDDALMAWATRQWADRFGLAAVG